MKNAYLESNVKKTKLRIAILGARCLPARYGGTETFTEKLALGLVNRGHKVIVYCCAPYQSDKSGVYQGIRRIIIPTIRVAALEKLFYAAISFINVCFTDTDIVLMNQIGGGPFCFLPRIFGKKVIVNPDGFEWKRSKWSWFGMRVLKTFEYISVVLANCIVADSKAIADYIISIYGKPAIYIPYGADPDSFHKVDFEVEKLNLKPESYCLQVCRLEPENNAHVVMREFTSIRTLLDLAIIGSSPFSIKYRNWLEQLKNPRIHLLGSIYGIKYRALMKNAFIYIHGHEVGGTNPVLLEAMAAGKCIVALDVPFNREVLANTGLYFTKETGDLASRIDYLASHPDEVEHFGNLAKQRVSKVFTWGRIIQEYEALFVHTIKKDSLVTSG
jgi:glycosyltransferase involved in cell wall biosynthesis